MLEIVRLTGHAGEARASVGESSPLNTPFPTGRGTILDNWLRVGEQGTCRTDRDGLLGRVPFG